MKRIGCSFVPVLVVFPVIVRISTPNRYKTHGQTIFRGLSGRYAASKRFAPTLLDLLGFRNLLVRKKNLFLDRHIYIRYSKHPHAYSLNVPFGDISVALPHIISALLNCPSLVNLPIQVKATALESVVIPQS